MKNLHPFPEELGIQSEGPLARLTRELEDLEILRVHTLQRDNLSELVADAKEGAFLFSELCRRGHFKECLTWLTQFQNWYSAKLMILLQGGHFSPRLAAGAVDRHTETANIAPREQRAGRTRRWRPPRGCQGRCNGRGERVPRMGRTTSHRSHWRRPNMFDFIESPRAVYRCTIQNARPNPDRMTLVLLRR